MLKLIKNFFKEEDGLGTVEIVIIIAVLVGVALLFRNRLIGFVNDMIDKIFPDTDTIQDNKDTTNATVKT
ncbi:MAG: hypothetical protein N3B21_06520 [Clostridia bacterium]|nr:hypothetical protein [Clostridia bacterium]